MKSLNAIQAGQVLDRVRQLFPDLITEIDAEPKPDPDIDNLIPEIRQRVLVIINPSTTRDQKKAAIRFLMRIVRAQS